jgi:hypothetical protein
MHVKVTNNNLSIEITYSYVQMFPTAVFLDREVLPMFSDAALLSSYALYGSFDS